MGGGREKMRSVKLNNPYSKDYQAFIYTGRGRSSKGCSTVTPLNPCRAAMKHPRFFGGADEWPPCCYGLTTVVSTAMNVVAKHHENNRGYKQPTKTDHVKTSCYCLV